MWYALIYYYTITFVTSAKFQGSSLLILPFNCFYFVRNIYLITNESLILEIRRWQANSGGIRFWSVNWKSILQEKSNFSSEYLIFFLSVT